MQLNFLDLGLIQFNKAYLIQKNTLQNIKQNNASNTILLCEHFPVITCGRSSKKDNILVDSQILEQEGIKKIDTDRGGDVTYHGPGQLVVYPIINLASLKKDIIFFLRLLEEIIINFLKIFGVGASTKENLTGVWVKDEKIASIGIGIRHWIVYHGLALNINTNLSHFSFIKPCGLDIKVTSLQKILNKTIDIKKSKFIIIEEFKRHLKKFNQAKNYNEKGNPARIR